jgi:hypothetical protein
MTLHRVRWTAVAALLVCMGATGCADDVGADPATFDRPAIDAGADQSSEMDPAADATVDVANEANTKIRDAGAEARDASTDADPDAPHGDALGVLAIRNQACSDCAVAKCQAFVDGCDQVAGRASHGPATGTPRSALCSGALTCMLASGCAEFDQRSCVCGPYTITGASSDCSDFPETATGPCKDAFARGLETSTPLEMLGSFTDLSKGGGWATLLYRCLFDNQCAACLPDHRDGGADGGD